MLPSLALVLFLELGTGLPGPQEQSQNSLFILDSGVGHRSTPVTRWRTSLRRLNPRGGNATVLQRFGPDGTPVYLTEPIGAYSLAYSASKEALFSATGQGIIRTNVDGSDPKLIISEDAQANEQIMSVAVAEKEGRLYYGTMYAGLIKRADYDGKNIEIVRNVSQGIDWGILPSFTPAYSYADGLVVDEEEGWLYWSASRGTDGGSIRRVAQNSDSKEQVLVSGIDMPGQLRLVRGTGIPDTLYWAEKGRWNTSPTAIKRLVLSHLSQSHPASGTAPVPPLATYVVVHSNQSNIFFEKDYTGDKQTLGVQSFVVYRNEVELKIWFVVQSSGRTIFGKLIEINWRGSGSGRKAELDVLNSDTRDIGVPVGLEHI